MGKSHRSKQPRKEPKCNRRKDTRKGLKEFIRQETSFEHDDLRQEKYEEENFPLSPALAAETSALYRSISNSDFPTALMILRDPNIEAEEKKFAAVTYVDANGSTVTHEAIRRDAPYELLELLLFIGGKKTVIAKDNNGYNTLHQACKRGSSSDVVRVLSFVGGKEALHQTDNFGELPIHKASFKNGASTDVLKVLIEVGGRETLEKKNSDEMLPVHCSVYYFNTNLEVCRVLITEGLHHGVGGDEGLGGLNIEYRDIDRQRKTTYQKLKQQNIANCLLKKISNVVSEGNGKLPVESGATAGLPWENGMEALVEATNEADIKEGLVVLAASGSNSDLATIFELIKRYVGVLFQ
mmetsp:Transcript_24029/g.35754  ORF Transcript_24029/g.35754 Transcript_24029/m.35754 type:complete len:353 (-) Transcript_24029:86-1144(-)